MDEQPAVDDHPDLEPEEVEASDNDAPVNREQSNQDDEVVSEDESKDSDPANDDDAADNEPQSEEDPPQEPAGDNDKNDFVALEDDEIEEKRFVVGGEQKLDSAGKDQVDKVDTKTPENKEVLPKTSAGNPKGKKSAK